MTETVKKEPQKSSEDYGENPEYLDILEPHKDPYSSDDENLKKSVQKKDNDCKQASTPRVKSKYPCLSPERELCVNFESLTIKSSDVTQSFIKTHFSAEYLTEGLDADTMLFSDNITTKDILKELFYFALKDDQSRMKTDDKCTKLYDSNSVDDIISKWQNDSSDAAWIVQNFIEDIIFGNVKLGESVNKLLTMKSAFSKGAMSAKVSNQNRLTFIKRFCEVVMFCSVMDVHRKLSHDELYEQYKVLVAQLAFITGVAYRCDSQCKYTSEVLDPYKGEVSQVVTKPDYLLESYCETLTLPVHVFVPSASDHKSAESTRIDCNLNSFQSYDLTEKLYGQHVMELINALHYKVKYVEKQRDENKKLVQIGMFITKKYLRFTKIQTTLRHLRSCFPDLLPRGGSFYMFSSAMRQRRESLKVGFSNWDLDISKAAHRNALIIFLSEYFHGLNYP